MSFGKSLHALVLITIVFPFIFVVLTIQWLLRILQLKPAARWMGHHTIRMMGYMYFGMLGLKIRVEGEENLPKGGCIFMSNHQSMLDILFVYGYVKKPMAMIAKKQLAWVPLVGPWMQDLGCYLMDRKDPKQALALFNTAAKNLKEKDYSVLIYPEGTRSRGPEMNEVRTASMRLPLMAEDYPIIPITLNGSWKVIYGPGFFLTRCPIKIVIHPPIYGRDYGKAKQAELAMAVEQAIKSGLSVENER